MSKTDKQSKFSQIAATGIIWGFDSGMLAVCIPLTAITKSGTLLPLAVILGASGSTAMVWQTNNRTKNQTPELNAEFQALKKRIVILEAICSTQELQIEEKFKHLEQSDRS